MSASSTRVAGPLMERRQISFEAEPLGGGYAPNDGTPGGQQGHGGNEFYQLYTLKNGQPDAAHRRQEPQRTAAPGARTANWLGLQLDPPQRHRQRSLRDGPARSGDRPDGRAGQGRRLGDHRLRARRQSRGGRQLYLGDQDRSLLARSGQRHDDPDRRPQKDRSPMAARNSRPMAPCG